MSEEVSKLSTVHHFAIRVYYEDTDAGGIVYYANYLKFFERARTEWLREIGINQQYFLQQKLGFVVRKVEMDNLASAMLDDLLEVKSTIITLKRASLVFQQQITNQAQQVLCTAKIRVACVDFSQKKPCAIPKPILGVFKRVS
ncbi:acyl-CoA thioesterase [Colwellia sp. MT41]|uniref:Tol-pal system-associated acyl-CoA thioesterase n=1 Tax=Colwellia marinimaniae TaxID=1513592 RepID=A0ABQ0MY73_9GAMM|nr:MULTISPECIES: tol-pal system-associated acyl-CoA thioesterase [Colwellia]ALO35215.1 acyl-CoA thioesterase [Colwellia sp. MT41]GAW97323.1 tol-pal system-associated acyl-CoA thioesterase [Colwellia marinimaniae]